MKLNFMHPCVIIIMLLSVSTLCGSVYAAKPLILAVHPFLSHEEVEKKFTPLANYLSDVTGLEIKVRVGSSYKEHIQYVGEDKVDIAYMGPASYVALLIEFGSKPILCKLEVDGRSYFQGKSSYQRETLRHQQGQIIWFADI